MRSAAPPAPFSTLFHDLPREHGFEPLRVEGRLPDDLRGTLCRNGPALFSSGKKRYGHWFDGDGAVSAVRLDGAGNAWGAVRVVDTPGLAAERRAGRRLYAGFGTRGPGILGEQRLARQGLPRRKNPANTSVLVWQDRLYALCEAGLPVEIARDDLGTLGERDLDGAVVATFSAHPHAAGGRPALYNFGVRYGRTTLLDVYELPFAGPARLLTTIPLPRATLIHDFIATERHLIFFAPPLAASVLPLLLGLRSLVEALRWKPNLGTEVIIVPIDSPRGTIRFTTEAFYQWHFANAYDHGADVVVDLVRYPDFTTRRWLDELWRGRLPRDPGARFARAVISRGPRRLRWEHVADVSCEFPRIAPAARGRTHRFVYLVGSERDAARMTAPYESIVAVDTATTVTTAWHPPAGHIPSEPVFVPRPRPRAENDGWLLTLVHDAGGGASHLAVLDAGRLGDGPVARAWFDQSLPLTFHGEWL